MAGGDAHRVWRAEGLIEAGSPKGLGECSFEGEQPGFRIAAEMDSQHGQVVTLERLEIARRLRVDQLAEGVRPAGDRAVLRMIGRELQEPADRRAALVELAGRVEETRAIAGCRGTAGLVAQQPSNSSG